MRALHRARGLLPVAMFAALAFAAPRVATGQGVTRLDSATRAAIAPIVARAQAAKLPVDLLYAKARQGQGLRLPAARIEGAVRALAQRLETASEALDPNPTELELLAATDALNVGVPAGTLREMRKTVRDGSLAVPIGVLTSLVARGVPVEKASVQVVTLLQRGANSNNFIALEQQVVADVLAGRNPDESLDLRLKAIYPNLPSAAAGDNAGLINATSPRKP